MSEKSIYGVSSAAGAMGFELIRQRVRGGSSRQRVVIGMMLEEENALL